MRCHSFSPTYFIKGVVRLLYCFPEISAMVSKADSTGEVAERDLLPLDPQGQVDWNALGDTLTARILEEVSDANFEYRNGTGSVERNDSHSEWKYCFQENDVTVLQKRLKNSPLKGFLGYGIIDLPLDQIAKVVADLGCVYLWDMFTTDARYIRVISESETQKDFIAYRSIMATRCFFKVVRDTCYYARSKFLDDGRYVLTVMSVADPKCPLVPGLTRMKLFSGTGWVLEPHNEQTLVVYTGQSDLVGFPPIVVNLGMKRSPMNVHFLRRFLIGAQRSAKARSRTSTSAPDGEADHEVTGRSSATPLRDMGPKRHDEEEDTVYEEPVPINSFIAPKFES